MTQHRTRRTAAAAVGAPAGAGSTTTRSDLAAGHEAPTDPADLRGRARAVLPSSRAMVGGLLVAVAMVATFALTSAAGGHPTGHVVVARRAMTIGHRIVADDVRLAGVDLPADLAARAFDTSAAVEGRAALAPIEPDQILGRSSVSATPASPSGHQFSFPVDRDRAVNGHLQAGEIIDVIATYGSGAAARTEVVARGVTLLAVEEAGRSTIGAANRIVVTISLADADQVLQAAHASEVAAITLVRATEADQPLPAGAGPPVSTTATTPAAEPATTPAAPGPATDATSTPAP